MTDKELDTYNFIVSYIEYNGYPPTVREIMEGVGLASTATICYRLSKLEKDGYIKVKLSSPRAINVVGYKFVKEK